MSSPVRNILSPITSKTNNSAKHGAKNNQQRQKLMTMQKQNNDTNTNDRDLVSPKERVFDRSKIISIGTMDANPTIANTTTGEIHTDFKRYVTLLQDDKWNTRNTAGKALRRLLQTSISITAKSKKGARDKNDENSNKTPTTYKNKAATYSDQQYIDLLKKLENIVSTIFLNEKRTIVIKSICLLVETFVAMKSIRTTTIVKSIFETFIPHLLKLSVNTQVGFSIPSKNLLQKIASKIEFDPKLLLNIYLKARNEPLIRMAVIELFIIKVNSWSLLSQQSIQQQRQPPADDLGVLMVLIPNALVDHFDQIPTLCTKLFLNIFEKHKSEATLIFENLKPKSQIFLLRDNEKIQIAYPWPKRVTSTPSEYHNNDESNNNEYSEKRREALNSWINAREKEQQQKNELSGSKLNTAVRTSISSNKNSSSIKRNSVLKNSLNKSINSASLIASKKKALLRINKKKKNISSKRQLLFDNHHQTSELENDSDENQSFRQNYIVSEEEDVSSSSNVMNNDVPRSITSPNVDLSLFSSIQEECRQVFENENFIAPDDTIIHTTKKVKRPINTPKLTENELDQIFNENEEEDFHNENAEEEEEVIKFSSSSSGCCSGKSSSKKNDDDSNIKNDANKETPVATIDDIFYNVVLSPNINTPQEASPSNSPAIDDALQKQLEQMQKDIEAINNIQNEAEEEMSNAVNEVKSARKNKVTSSPAIASALNRSIDNENLISPQLDAKNMKRDLRLLKQKRSSSSSSIASLSQSDNNLSFHIKNEEEQIVKVKTETKEVESKNILYKAKSELKKPIVAIKHENIVIEHSSDVNEKSSNNTIEIEKELEIFFEMMEKTKFASNLNSIDIDTSNIYDTKENELVAQSKFSFSALVMFMLAFTFCVLFYCFIIFNNMSATVITTKPIIQKLLPAPVEIKQEVISHSNSGFNSASCFPVITTESDENFDRNLCFDPITQMFHDVSFNDVNEEANVNVGVIEGGRDAVAIKPIATYNLHELVNEQTININNKANDEFNFQNDETTYLLSNEYVLDLSKYEKVVEFLTPTEYIRPYQTFRIHEVFTEQKTSFTHTFNNKDGDITIKFANNMETTYLVDDEHFVDLTHFNAFESSDVDDTNTGSLDQETEATVTKIETRVTTDGDSFSTYVSIVFVISCGLFIGINYEKFNLDLISNFSNEGDNENEVTDNETESNDTNGFNAVHVSVDNEGKVTTLTPVRRSIRVQKKVARSLKKVESFDINLTSEDVKKFLITK